MPRIVYGVLAVHPSHRIEIPEPARARAAGRPNACTLCPVDRDNAWAIRERARLWPGSVAPPPDPDGGTDLSPRSGAFGGDPIVRALSVDALGQAPWPAARLAREGALRARAAALVEVVAADRYPAVRHLAARALAAVFAGWPGHDQAAATARTYDATAPAEERAGVVAALRHRLAEAGLNGAGPDERARMARLRAEARRVDIDIGE
jgi:hypothetical protein